VTTLPDTEDQDAPVRRPGPVARVLLVPVNFYRRWISPVLPPSCRFEPSCSAYAVEALTTHGALRGSWLSVRRLLRCGPWHPGGYDPVPPRHTDLDEPTTKTTVGHSHTAAKE
jgi:putative membrane protein insertion efficiency factor